MENLLSKSQLSNLPLKTKFLVGAAVAFAVMAFFVRQPGLLTPEAASVPQEAVSDKASPYWAVYLDTGQVFYGQKFKSDKTYVIMTKAFYYQPGVRSAVAGNIRIIKVGTEIHQPEDKVYVNRAHIERQEQLSAESKVVKAIEKYNE